MSRGDANELLVAFGWAFLCYIAVPLFTAVFWTALTWLLFGGGPALLFSLGCLIFVFAIFAQRLLRFT